MELFQLRYFMCVAKHENFSRAAEELLISQPSLSKAISQIEDEFGVLLFDRIGKKIRINNAGIALRERLSTTLAMIDNLPKELRVASGSTQSTITVNVLACSSVMPDLLSQFKSQYPLVNFQLIQRSKDAKSDLCITSTLPYVLLNNAALLLSEELKFAVPAASPLAVKDSVDLTDIENECLVMLNESSILSGIVNHFFSMCGCNPNIACRSDNPSMIRDLVAAGLGSTIWPEITWGNKYSDKIKLITIRNPICMRNIFMTWPDGQVLTPQVKIFLEFAKNYFKQLFLK